MLPTICILAGGLGQRLPRNARRASQTTARRRRGAIRVPSVASTGGARCGAGGPLRWVSRRNDRGAGRQARYGIAIDYSYDSSQLDGTLGAIRRALPLLGDRFLVLYGDTYLRLDYSDGGRGLDRERRASVDDSASQRQSMGQFERRVCGRPGACVRQAPPHSRDALDRLRIRRADDDAIRTVDEREGDLAVLYRRLARIGSLYGFLVDRTLLRDRYADGARRD